MTSTLETAVRVLKRRLGAPPPLAMVLGSGFSGALREAQVVGEVPFRQLPGFEHPSVPGHAGLLRVARVEGLPVLLQYGRLHYYEGLSMEDVVFPVRVLAQWGVQSLLLTNAAGGIRPGLGPGNYLGIQDHINLMGANPLRGCGLRKRAFVDLTEAYDRSLLVLQRHAAQLAGVAWKKGVYLAVSGPNFETPAEIRAFRRLGADAVGMSTVPEVLAARQAGVRVSAVSLITNAAAGLGRGGLSHQEVLDAARAATGGAGRFLGLFARLYHRPGTPSGRKARAALK